MKLLSTAVAVILIALAVTAASAQTTGTKIAVFEAQAFYDAKTGITRIIKMHKALETEFKPLRDELEAMTAQYKKLSTEISNARGSSNPNMKAMEEKADQAEKLRRDISSKQESAQAAFNKRSTALRIPIEDDILMQLKAFAKQRKIDVVVNLDKSAGTYIVIEDAVDITRAFITEYNARNP